MTLKADWRREYREGEVVICALGYRVRFYAGHTFVDRPRIHPWRIGEHRGVCVRFTHGVRHRRVFGVQWRPLVDAAFVQANVVKLRKVEG